ncbi:MAG: hypothetical protein KGJ60_11585 [Verrucomicrobiota bacterium]|nr:hypothetical protein [Verrucomicrobiota bacterium]
MLHPSAANAGFIRFKPRVTTSGEYDLWVRWFPSRWTNSTQTPLIFHTPTGPQRLVLDQSQEGIKWLRLGAYRFDAGETVDLTFSGEGANGAVVAKAVALVRRR